MPAYPNREDALALLHEYTKTDSLRRHALGVEQDPNSRTPHIDQLAAAGVGLY